MFNKTVIGDKDKLIFSFKDVTSHYVHPLREFHISRIAREYYGLDETLFSLHGRVIFANVAAAKQAAYNINQKRDVQRFPERSITTGDLYAAGIIDEVFHLVIAVYKERINDQVLTEALDYLQNHLGQDKLLNTLRAFAKEFPATAVYHKTSNIESYLEASTDGIPHTHIVLEELLMLWLANENPALERFLDLFDDRELTKLSAYSELVSGLKAFFKEHPPLASELGSIVEMLQAPAKASPTSLEGQLEYMREHWAYILGDAFADLLGRLLQGLDLLKEERKQGALGPGPSHVLDADALRGLAFKRGRHEYERFSTDQAWMPKVVMLAKSTYVWLDQLSKKFQRNIYRLDHVPDEELDELARRGFTALWLIGLWERSEASKRIKHLRGQPDAVASAYALYDYQLANDLGGEEAYTNLRDRAWQRGIRLASDMVPNHVGIDGRWVIEHPEWFLQLDHVPYPSYSFNGPNLSNNDRIGIYLEDHYFDNSDAAVVFKRLDHWSGEARYIYHGNDGTSMPWNDTAQIDYLNAEAREAIIQTILHVARKFPIIRFDAAMTLAKQHIQRLWFPEPGTGGAIPSRAQYGSMSAEAFDQLIPNEFWREVVDRVAKEVPDTLLLAEAFWMMEGYFVRTLGMHRVYNSAFMNMLKNEDNANYRQLIKNVLEFDPQILRRFVNFMNNPDEDTAIAQFGKDDKYFGVCLLMSTMPGLPMFGHGQIEGLHEKYGMEFRTAKWDENPDEWLINRHYKDIFPLLHRRAEFAGVEHFLLYDLYTSDGHVNEDVFAYSNRFENTASLIIYNNKFAKAKGWIKRSVAYKDKQNNQLKQRDLHEGLATHGDHRHFVIMHEATSGQEYLKRSSDIQHEGLYIELEAFKYQVFLNIREVFDQEGLYEHLYQDLGGNPVANVAEAITDLQFRPLNALLTKLVDQLTASDTPTRSNEEPLKTFEDFVETAKAFGLNLSFKPPKMPSELFSLLVKPLQTFPAKLVNKQSTKLEDYLNIAEEIKPLLIVWYLGKCLASKQFSAYAVTQLLRMDKFVSKFHGEQARALLELLFNNEALLLQTSFTPQSMLDTLLKDPATQKFLKVNEHQGIHWFNKEAFHLLVIGMVSAAWILRRANKDTTLKAERVLTSFKILEDKSNYQLEALQKALA